MTKAEVDKKMGDKLFKDAYGEEWDKVRNAKLFQGPYGLSQINNRTRLGLVSRFWSLGRSCHLN